MSEPPAPSDDPMLARARRIDEIANRFEVAWNTGQRPRIEDFIGAVPEAERAALVRELVALEMSCRRQAGEAVQEEYYRARFPDLTTAPETSGAGSTGAPSIPGYEI